MTAATFPRAAAFTMAQEGGAKVSDHAADPGGLTKYGISQRAYPSLDIRALTEAEALAIYKRDYWDRVRGDELPWPLDLALFDFVFHSGSGNAVTTLQRLLGVKADGAVGPVTLATSAKSAPVALAHNLNAERLLFLSSLKTWPNFGRGWTRRVLALQAEIGK